MTVQENQQSVHEQIAHLPGEILFSLARNEAASPDFRKAAIQLMLEKGCYQVDAPELALLVSEVRKSQEARDEVEAIVESAIEQPLSGPLRASVTTSSLGRPDIIRNAGSLGDDALSE